ncbi:hypothetical protein HKBW3S25_01849, partial [Candidatus Hakubella thermalkaliphila]
FPWTVGEEIDVLSCGKWDLLSEKLEFIP